MLKFETKTMQKLIRLILLLFVLLTLVGVFLFNYFKPNEQVLEPFDSLNVVKIKYIDLLNQVNETPKAFFFCTLKNQNCIYTENEIIEPLLKSASSKRFEQIFFVDVKELNQNVLPSAIKERLGFSHFPAFVLLNKVDGKINILSVLEWNDAMNFTQYDLKNWMIQNQLWLDEYTN
jgi:hypothetical protein